MLAPVFRPAIQRVFSALVLLGVITVTGGVCFWWLGQGQYSFGQAVYFAVITISTVGYAELPGLETHPWARLVTGALIISGIGTIAYFQSTLTALLVEGVIAKAFRRRRMDRKIAALKNHMVVAGCGRTGKYIVEELVAIGQHFIVIDRDEALVARINDEVCGGKLLYVIGDATEDHTLIAAGVQRAHGVVAALSEDRDNLFVTLSARSINPRARIVSKAVEVENEPKILKAGADTTVSPNRIGGMRLVSELVRPKVTAFLDQMLRVTKNLRFEEVAVQKGSTFVGKTLRELPIRENTNLLVVALHEPEGGYIYNPSPDHQINVGTQLIVMGEIAGVEKLRDMVAASREDNSG